MPWYFLVPLILVGLAAVLFLVGSMLPRDHSATSTITLKASPEQVFAAITDWRQFQSWRKNLTAVEEFTMPDGRKGWVEVSNWGRMPLVVEKSEPGRLLVGRIADDSLPFGGTWTHRLEPLPGGGTKLATTEDGFVKPAFFRVMMLVFGAHKTLNEYQTMLAAKFGETVTPVNS
jgi:uncharacterized protein YndB with AHSA1/START domain